MADQLRINEPTAYLRSGWPGWSAYDDMPDDGRWFVYLITDTNAPSWGKMGRASGLEQLAERLAEARRWRGREADFAHVWSGDPEWCIWLEKALHRFYEHIAIGVECFDFAEDGEALRSLRTGFLPHQIYEEAARRRGDIVNPSDIENFARGAAFLATDYGKAYLHGYTSAISQLRAAGRLRDCEDE